MELPYKVPKWLVWLVTGWCFFLPFLYFELWLLLLVAIILWLHLITKGTIKEIVIGSFLVGFAKYGGGIFWFWETYPVEDFVVIPAWQQLLLIGYFCVFTAGSMAVAMAVVGVVFSWLIRKYQSLLLLIFIPVIFVAGEILASILFCLYSYGPGVTINANFTFGYVGLPWSQLQILFPFMAVLGIYGLSFLVALLGCLGFLSLQRESLRPNYPNRYLLIVASLILIAYLVIPQPKVNDLDTTVVAVETRFDKEMSDTDVGQNLKQEQVVEATLAALQLSADIVLLPEDSRLTRGTETIDETLGYLESTGKTSLVVDSFRSDNDKGEAILRAVYYDLEDATTFSIDKQYLVPIGEYVMNFEAWSLRLLKQEAILDKLSKNQNYIPGPQTSYENLSKNVPGVLFCFESVAPLGVKKVATTRDIPLVLHPISHSWFNHPDILWQSLDAMLQIQAIWNKTMIVSAGNMSPSKIYYPDGVISTGKVIMETKYWRLVEYNL